MASRSIQVKVSRGFFFYFHFLARGHFSRKVQWEDKTTPPSCSTMNSFNLLSASSGSAIHPNPVAAAAPAVQSGLNVAAAAAMPTYAAGSSTGVAAMPVYTATYAAAAVSYSSDEEDDLMPWERGGWRPLEKSGKQKTPNKIRGELQRYIDVARLVRIVPVI